MKKELERLLIGTRNNYHNEFMYLSRLALKRKALATKGINFLTSLHQHIAYLEKLTVKAENAVQLSELTDIHADFHNETELLIGKRNAVNLKVVFGF